MSFPAGGGQPAAQGAGQEPTQVRKQTDTFINILEAAASREATLAAGGAAALAVANRPAASGQDIDKLASLLVRKMPEFIVWGQTGMIEVSQVEKLQHLARTFAPRLVRIAAEKRAQTVQQSPVTPVAPSSGQPPQKFEGTRWTALAPSIVFAPPANLPHPNQATSIPPPYTQNPPASFNLHLPQQRPPSPPPPTIIGEGGSSPNTMAYRAYENIFPKSPVISEEAKIGWERDDGRAYTWPAWVGGGTERPTMTLGLSDGFGGSSLSTPPFILPTSSFGVPEPRIFDPSQPLPPAEETDTLGLVLSGDSRTMTQVLRSLQPELELDPSAESFLLAAADEFIESVAQFAADMALHRGSDTLEPKDLQLHLERNYNVRLPNYASDETRLALTHATLGLAPASGTKASKDGGMGASGRGVRAARLAAIGR
ncbi:hypothetical protein CALVIDRAFT_540837 [Calocera viscosa TUFC12733]|uniref:Transcription initiation factor TFIID subunit 12 domain-containing protein n=1 Tax=Calocera viscosa (strain TUFC12733) TaxID=1330018 RepID=A0A167IEG1_CALVF|nr:hypothetical protein CALVIDRAFT_540837 [Calocera viscosa TUFC12733]